LIYKEKGQYELALNYYENYSKIKDSIASMNIKEKINQLHTEYETEKKEQEIQYLNTENQLKDKKLQVRSIFMISLIIIFVMAFLLTLLLLRQKNLRIQNMNVELRNFLLEVEELKTALSNKHEWHENQINELFDKYEITGREADVLHLISLGHSNFEIADKLFISINTVKYHIKNIYLKLDAKNRVEIINKFTTNNLAVS
jgi:DNA-binding CsgD family transcriptional regulator